MLEVYTHDSLNVRPGAITADEHGGSVRLITLGEQVLEAAVMTNLFRRRPMHPAEQLKVTLLSFFVVVSDLSDVWRVDNDRGMSFQEQCRSMDSCL